MGYNNPPVPWSEIERKLSDRPGNAGSRSQEGGTQGRESQGSGVPGDGGDAPAWSRRREPYEPPSDWNVHRRSGSAESRKGGHRYGELHCHSAFSFLDGASEPEALAEEAARLELTSLAITDHHGFYGVVRFSTAARALGLPSVFGAELSINATEPRPGPADPNGGHLLVLARDPTGYAQLSTLLSAAQMAGEKGRPSLSFADVAEAASGRARDHWAVLTACRKGTVPAALESAGPAAAERELRSLVAAFGPQNTFVELWDHGDPLDTARNDALARMAVKVGVQPLATNNVHYATPAQRPLATAMAAVRSRRSLDELDGWLPGGGAAHLRSGAEQHRRFLRYPGVLEAAADLGDACAFDLSLVAPALPPYPCGADSSGREFSEADFLRRVTEAGAERRYGPRHAERVHGAWAQIDRELDLICSLGFPGYFLIVWDLVEFCRRNDILCQGRGSAANSAVCYALGITAADAVGLGLLFERFMSPERDGPPDIDIDIESDRREEVIQYVYGKHGRTHAAQVANVITYRARSAVRDAAKALGFAPGQQDAWSKQMGRWGGLADQQDRDGESTDPTAGIPGAVLELAAGFEDLPRHLGIHSGGMVLCDRPVVEVCPTEWARMENRSVLQWDKEDCAAAGLVKFDLLGLGMLSAIHYAIDFVADHHGVEVDLAELPQEDAVYEMLCRADTVGVFQIESRAQMATLPRLRPRCFYDLVIEVALIRPGPIQGGSVHPYIRRRKGEEPITYLHPLLENSLKKTLGIPLFQEQLMQIAIDVAGFSAAEADELRQAIASKRSVRRMAAMKERFDAGLARNGIVGDTAVALWEKLAAFANYGFPESHSVSFAYLVYASSWLKYHYPAAFCAALLKAQPMGFYSPQSLSQDARRHGVEVRTPLIGKSDWCSTLEDYDADSGYTDDELGDRASGDRASGNRASGTGASRNRISGNRAAKVRDPDNPATWGWGGPAVRLGLSSVRGISDDLAKEIVANAPYGAPEELARRVGLNRSQLEALATAGALGSFVGADGLPMARREALWSAGAASKSRPGRLPGMVEGTDSPKLPGMEEWEVAVADLWATGVAPDGHPTKFIRADLDRLGAVRAIDLAEKVDGAKVLVGGVVTHRQRPATAAGVTFMSLEDETGLVNVVCSVGCWQRHNKIANSSPALMVRGKLERSADGVINLVAERLENLEVTGMTTSRDFR